MADVASDAGVSETTVSHVLSGRRPVAVATQERVRTSIRRLNYRPNELARALRTQRSHTVAFVVPNIAHVLYPVVARGVGDILRPLGFHVAIYETDDNPGLAAEVIQSATDRGIDGAILFGFALDVEGAAVLNDHHIPYVNGGLNDDDEPDWDTVRSDQFGGMYKATSRALSLTSETIGFIGGTAGLGPADIRERGFRAAMTAGGRVVDERVVGRTDYSYVGGREAFARMVGPGNIPRAVVCANDLIAIGAMACAHDQGFSIPEDIAFSGYDNIEACTMVVPTLTSVETHLQEQGRACAELLIERIAGEYRDPARHRTLPTDVVDRDSTKAGRRSRPGIAARLL